MSKKNDKTLTQEQGEISNETLLDAIKVLVQELAMLRVEMEHVKNTLNSMNFKFQQIAQVRR